MKNTLFGIGVGLVCFGGAGLAGNIETDGNLILPLVIALIGLAITLITRKAVINEEKNRVHIYSGNSTRPNYLPK